MRDELGFDRYAAHGSDLGAGITSRLGEAYPESLVGIHLLAVAAPQEYDPASLRPDERAYLDQVATWSAEEGGYQHQQNTRPLTQPPRSWAERTYNITRYTSMPRGGHFAAHEEPELLADDITEFFRQPP